MDPDQLTPTEAIKVLRKLPKSNLDDRDYKDLVNECMLRIPRYCPEWTNHNPSDPGITLIEMFAWLTDQMLLRFNQVPRRQYIAYLELLGITLEPAKPAATEITFYLSRPQSAESRTRHRPIKAGTEVATERTDNQAAISFSTDQVLDISRPHLSHFLLANDIPIELEGDNFVRAFAQKDVTDGLETWHHDDAKQTEGHAWRGDSVSIFSSTPPERHDGFYLVLNPADILVERSPKETEGQTDSVSERQSPSLAGHVITLDIKGKLAAPTGINPKSPPRRWKAWTGETWTDVLSSEAHDGTFGFSFDEMGQPTQPPNQLPGQSSGARSGKVTLHMPLSWAKDIFDSASGGHYEGFWLCCVHNAPALADQDTDTIRYTASPEFEAMTIAAVGGSVNATQCTYVKDELIGESNGKPGQQFSLQSTSILAPTEDERLTVTMPGALEEDAELWEKVDDFADSNEGSPHYTINLRTGTIQLGPLVREPQDLPKNVGLRRQIQKGGKDPDEVLSDNDRSQKQYGKVPPKGSILKMQKYRTGGGQKGDVQQGALCILKRAIPYVTQVTNHKRAKGGIDEKNLEQAVMEVPKKLRTQERAVTAEDFETLAQKNSHIQRVRCLSGEGGKVQVLLIPYVDESVNPHGAFSMSAQVKAEVKAYLAERSLLGIAIEVREPEYVRVRVKVDISLRDPQLSDRQKNNIEQEIHQHICDFIHPTKGGWDGNGWPFDTPLHESDIVAYLHREKMEKVRAIGNVQLFLLASSTNPVETAQTNSVSNDRWEPRPGKIALERSQLFYAWESDDEPSRNHHAVQFSDEF